jgi:hypothetical protein
MIKSHGFKLIWGLSIFLMIIFFTPKITLAHCDGVDGPVVMAAKNALETGNINLVLIWVQKKDEGALRHTYEHTMAVRKLGPTAKELADMYFFETLVRIHRAGEGASYTGLKPAGRDLGPAIPAADKALKEGKLEPLYKLLSKAVHDGLHAQFEKAMSRKNYNKENVEAGREFIEAYVTYVHYVERLYEAAAKASHGHYPEPAEEHAH